MSNLDNLLDGFEETEVRTTTAPDGSRIEITWIENDETLVIGIVAGGGQLVLTGQSEPIDQVEVVLTGGAARAFWASLQRPAAPPTQDPFSGPDWPPRPSEL